MLIHVSGGGEFFPPLVKLDASCIHFPPCGCRYAGLAICSLA